MVARHYRAGDISTPIPDCLKGNRFHAPSAQHNPDQFSRVNRAGLEAVLNQQLKRFIAGAIESRGELLELPLSRPCPKPALALSALGSPALPKFVVIKGRDHERMTNLAGRNQLWNFRQRHQPGKQTLTMIPLDQV